MTTNYKIQSPQPFLLSWPIPLLAILMVSAVLLPLIYWFGLANPELFPGLFKLPWDDTGIFLLASGSIAALFFIPLGWMLISRRGDFTAMWLMQNALLAGGYFFLPATAALDIPSLTTSIIAAGGLIVIINAVGFLILLGTLGITYFITRITRAEVRTLEASPETYDQRLLFVLRVTGLFNVGVIVLAMAVSHTIPMLSSDPGQARYVFEQNGATRALYNAGMAILPFTVGGLVVMFLRKPRRLWGLDGALAGAIVMAQALSGNRFTLAIAAMVVITLVSVEKKMPRWLLLSAVMGYLILFVGLAGLTSLWRQQDRASLSNHGDILSNSFREAYIGNNLIDYRDAAWVFSQWDHQPLMGASYLGGLSDMIPSAVFPQKKQWHLGQIALKIVGWEDEQHFGLRVSCFGESFLNFGFAGVLGMGTILGIALGVLLRYLHLLGNQLKPCLARNLNVIILMQMLITWTNSADAYVFWALLLFWAGIQVIVFYTSKPGTLTLKPAAAATS
ncbi:MAG TPA: O-antigen polymerase [Verrucomicrobiae bacterium]